MNKSLHPTFTIFGLSLFSVFYAQAGNKDTNSTRPNIIVILADDMGYNDVSFNGSTDITTPELDKLAKAGTICTSGYVTHPFSGPSRAALMTGRYPACIGTPYNLLDDGTRNDDGVPTSETFISNVLMDGGYHTAAIGKWHLGFSPRFQPNNRGFNEFYGFLAGGHQYDPSYYIPEYNKKVAAGTYPINEYFHPLLRNTTEVDETEYLTDAFSREAVRIINESPARNKPFFIYLAYNAPHAPVQAKADDIALFASIPDVNRRKYAAMVYALDRGVGNVVTALKATNQFENTLIVFLSDNGGPTDENYSSNYPLKNKKGDVDEGGIRVPMFFHWPNVIPAGQKTGIPISSVDLYPTFTAIANATLPTNKILDGRNVLADIQSNTNSKPDRLIYSVRYRSAWGDLAVRRGDWKAIRTGSATASWKLYNITADISETTDLSGTNNTKLLELVTEAKKWCDTHITPVFFYSSTDKSSWASAKLPNYTPAFSMVSGIFDVSTDDNFKVYQNRNGQIVVNCQNNDNEEVSMSLYNMIGQNLYAIHSNDNILTIDKTLSKGNYIVNITFQGVTRSKKVIIN